jgi:methionyl-tRNA formyltransferase
MLDSQSLVLCIYGRAGFEAINHILLNKQFGYSRIIVFSHEKNNEQLLTFIKTLNIELYTDSINKHKDKLEGLNGLLLSIHYRYIISSEILSVFNGTKVNLHPSLLPNYKGCFSSTWALINNEKRTGITYHIITKDVDEGNILIQEGIDITDTDTSYSLFHKLITLGISRLGDVFTIIRNGSAGIPQEGKGSYYPRKLPYEGKINNEWDDDMKSRFTRAMIFPPFPPAKFE